MKAGEHIGPYRITRRLGEGGIGEVFQAFDESLARDVAIKRLRPELAERATLANRFRAEAQTLARLNHPNIATLYALVDEGDATYMVMEYVEGDTVAALLRERGALDLEPGLRLAFQALAGIGCAHDRGVIHRDIKGSNLMLDANGTLKVMDFGIARVLGDERHTRAGQLIGTPEFMSPEQIRGDDADERSDLYSLAILLFSLFTGRPPFQARSEYDLMKAQVEEQPPSIRDRHPELPRELDAVLRKALAKDAGERFQNAAEFRAALQPFANDSWTDGPLRWPARKPDHAECSLIDDAELDAPTQVNSGAPVSRLRASASETDANSESALPLIDAVLLDADSLAETPAPASPQSDAWSAEATIDERETVPPEADVAPRAFANWLHGPRLAAAGFAIGAVLGLDLISAAPQPPPVSAGYVQECFTGVQLEASRPPIATLGPTASARDLRENLFTTNQSSPQYGPGSAALEALGAAESASDAGRAAGPGSETSAETAPAEAIADRAQAAGRVGRSTEGKVKSRPSERAGKRGEQGWVIRR